MPDLGGPIESFTASMKVLIGGSACCTRGNPPLPSPADGLSFNFANADDPAVLAADGSGWIAGAAEEGTTTGLSICLDTWDNAGGEAPNIDVKLDGVLIATARTAGLYRDPESFLTPGPTPKMLLART